MSDTVIDQVLDRIRESSQNTREVGDRFERMMLAFFRLDRSYASQFEQVWLWSDWPGNDGKPDTGIDLVAKNARDDGYTAIQCKCYAPSTRLDKSDIDSFFTASGKAPFTNRIIVSTTNRWTKHAEDALRGQDKPVQRLGLADLGASSIDWTEWDLRAVDKLRLRPRKSERPHQTEAIRKTLEGLRSHNRGKIIMACGTGKTYTALRIAEEFVGAGGLVLVLMPSISLLSQTLKEWTADALIPVMPLAVCSDTKAGRRHNTEDSSAYELMLPATTDPEQIVAQYQHLRDDEDLTVIFSTYQSLSVVAAAQAAGVPAFDLIIADEAHRTTGVTLADEDDSSFTRIHDGSYINGTKRLYMTATPRVFSDSAKGKAAGANAVLASMDDPSLYGPEFYRLGFHEAVERDLLTDYKVLILAVDEAAVSRAFQRQLSDENNEIRLDDATRIVGCANALAKYDVTSASFSSDPDVMRRAVAFSNTIAQSKKFTNLFSEVASQWNDRASTSPNFDIQVSHVDGKLNSFERESLIRWLKTEPPEGTCRILSNAKCLTEGVDVPNLDAIIFLEPRNSMVDVIQAVGRVMRKAGEQKKFGYVILPIGIPADQSPEEALSDNQRFKAVWQILNALRSHDERMNAVVNKLDLNDEPPSIIEVIPVTDPPDEIEPNPTDTDDPEKPRQLELGFPIDELREGIYAKMVLKVGTRHYWEDWAADVAAIAARHQTRISALIEDPRLKLSAPFEQFVQGLQATINSSISRDDAITMLSQHLITKPIFDALFGEFEFSESNPVSQAMQGMIDLLDAHSLDKETATLEAFYESVRLRVEGIDNDAGKQKIITELYEQFFSKAFPKAAESLGIVYTPIQVVDYVIHAADHALRRHFDGLSVSDAEVHVLDPFCGTGTFIVRLLQSGIIKPEDLARKYSSELHSNEYLLLAYYIAAINIESTYHAEAEGLLGIHEYAPFEGVVLTDTFQLSETGEGTGSLDVFPANNQRATRQKSTDVRVIVGNPPYSAGQTNQNDNNQNLSYPATDRSISETYAALTDAKLKNSLYDSYVRAFRWSSNRVSESGRGGIIAFVTNGSFLEGNSFDGFRKSVAAEFHHVYCCNLRGNALGAGEGRKKEGGNVFGGGSRTSVAITILVREPRPIPDEGAAIHYCDIGDYLSREQKLEVLSRASTQDALDSFDWSLIEPNEHGDWINQRSNDYDAFVAFSAQSGEPESIFEVHTNGIKTNRDAWNINFSSDVVVRNARRMIDFYNSQLEAFERQVSGRALNKSQAVEEVKDFVCRDPKLFSWDRSDFDRIARGLRYNFEDVSVRTVMYRPFVREHVNFANNLNNTRAKQPLIFPDSSTDNVAIAITGTGTNAPFAALAVREVGEYQLLGNTVYYPRYLAATGRGSEAPALFVTESSSALVENVTAHIQQVFSKQYGRNVTGDEIFAYTYGVLHSPVFRERHSVDFAKGIPRLPMVGDREALEIFVSSGQELLDLHLNFESAAPWPDLEIRSTPTWDASSVDAYKVEKMRYAKVDGVLDFTTLHFNSRLTIASIPPEVHEYRLGPRSALDWIVDRYQVKTDTASGITNDPNLWAMEHDDPAYVFDLVRRIVTVSMRTNEIVSGLPVDLS